MLTPDMIQQVAPAVGFLLVAIVWAGRQVGWIKPKRQEAIEPRAEQMWRSEAEAQKERADRLESEITDMRVRMAQMRSEIDIMKARPDYSTLLERFDQHHQEMVDVGRSVTVTLARIATAVIPPTVIRD